MYDYAGPVANPQYFEKVRNLNKNSLIGLLLNFLLNHVTYQKKSYPKIATNFGLIYLLTYDGVKAVFFFLLAN